MFSFNLELCLNFSLTVLPFLGTSDGTFFLFAGWTPEQVKMRICSFFRRLSWSKIRRRRDKWKSIIEQTLGSGLNT